VTTLSSHVLDTERGTPAVGLRVRLLQSERELASAETGADGRIADLGSNMLVSGKYRLIFDVGSYLERQGRPAPFVQQLTLEFRVDGAQRHYHIPLLLTPFSCSVYRGV
jgi:5-hydroxyisourate hydrolase